MQRTSKVFFSYYFINNEHCQYYSQKDILNCTFFKNTAADMTYRTEIEQALLVLSFSITKTLTVTVKNLQVHFLATLQLSQNTGCQ